MTADRELWRSRAWAPERVAKRWLAARGNRFVIFEASLSNLTIREVETDGAGLPLEKLAAARQCVGRWPPRVRLD